MVSGRLVNLGERWAEIASKIDMFDASSVFRNYVEIYAGKNRWPSILEYWTESSKERLGALKGPYDRNKRIIPDSSSYRSILLDNLAAKFQPTPHQSNELEPTLRQYAILELTDPRRIAMVGEVRKFKQDAANLFFPELCDQPIKDGTISIVFLDGVRAEGTSEISIKRDGRGVLFSANAFDSSLTLNAYFDYALGYSFGKTQVIFFVSDIDSGVFDSKHIADKSIATFVPGDLIPGFDFSLSFEKNKGEVATQGALAAKLFATTLNCLG